MLYPGLEDPDDGLEFGVVAPDQWKAQSTFAGWLGYYEWRGGMPADPVAVQVFVSGAPATRLLLLDDPTSEVSTLVNPPPRRSPPLR